MPTFDSETLRASPSTSNPSASSSEFDQRSKTSKTSQYTDQTLITPLVFGNDPQVKPVPDLVPWDVLTNEQWKPLVSKDECPIREVEIGVFKDLDESFFRDDIWYNDDLYDHDKDFDAVDAFRTRFVKGEQTRRASHIIDTRSGLRPTLIADEHSTARKGVVEGYAKVRLMFFPPSTQCLIFLLGTSSRSAS